MKIIKNNGKPVAKDVRVCRNPFSRALGLMFQKPRALMLESPFESIAGTSIHMWFMRGSIDVVWLNAEKKVVDCAKGLKPFALKIFKPKKPAKYVLELPKETIKKKKIEVGELLRFV